MGVGVTALRDVGVSSDLSCQIVLRFAVLSQLAFSFKFAMWTYS
jgi:hypothetical protein